MNEYYISWLDEAEMQYAHKVDFTVAEVRHDFVVPFCKKHGLNFRGGMGTWALFWADQRHNDALNEEEIEGLEGGPEVLTVLNYQIGLWNNDIGSVMEDYDVS